MLQFRKLDPRSVTVLMCDADGNLFPSEEPAFVASAEVTNRFMASLGLCRRFDPEELRLATTGKNFRTTAVDLAVGCGVPVEPVLAVRYPNAVTTTTAGPRATTWHALTVARLEDWVQEEKQAVTTYLGKVLRPDPAVIEPLTALSRDFQLVAVSSSATARLAACFTATGLDMLIPAELRFSAEDSLPAPTSKPDPAVYLFAGERLGIAPLQGLAIEDSVPGAQSAVAAGLQTIGNVAFVPPTERAERIDALRQVGVGAVIWSWGELEGLLDQRRIPAAIAAE
ncbi:MAG: HAD family phosphatase [Actinomycetota bacterium]|nr:HAD family phosphatase [Actinomycetota bacterium]MDQ4010438.1 HAD family phosphatase [Actinomycetota bacterium]